MDANLGVGTMRKLIELAEQNNVNGKLMLYG